MESDKIKKVDFKAWDTKREMFTNFMIVDNMFKFMDKVTGAWFRDDEQKRFKLMQSTGLFDKNGKEIYEGDIVKGYSVYPETSIFEPFLMGEVHYTNRGTWDSYSYILGGFNEQVEIIGNIYENKELIEVEYN